jgi:pentatricopeptide repeat protein
VIYAYGRKGQMKEASRLFSEMKCSGVKPDIVTYNIFIKSYVANAMFEEAIDLVRYMVAQGCKPNERTYNSILQGYCRHGRMVEAKSFLTNLPKLYPGISKQEKQKLLEVFAKHTS